MRVLASFLLLQRVFSALGEPSKADKEVSIEHAMKVEGLVPLYTKRGVLRQHGTAVSIEQNELTQMEANDLVNSVKNNGYYYVRIPVNTNEDNTQYVSTLVKACTLVSSKLKDSLTIHYSPQTGTIIGLDYNPSNLTCANKAYINKIGEGSKFKTTIVVITKSKPGPSVVLTPESQQKEAPEEPPVTLDAEGNPVVQPQNDPGFFGKYWMYILPVMLFFNTIMSPPPQTEGQEGEGGERKQKAQ